MNLFACRPRNKFWNPLKKGSCFNYYDLNLNTGFFNIISDFAILILPIPSIWNLNVSLKKKLRILAVFATGLL